MSIQQQDRDKTEENSSGSGSSLPNHLNNNHSAPSSSTSTIFTDSYSPTAYSPPQFSLNRINHNHNQSLDEQEQQNTSSGGSIDKSSNKYNMNNHYPHAAIKIIPEDVELSSGMHRSRSSSVQLHLPALINPASSVNGGASGSSTHLTNGTSNSTSPSISRSNSPGNVNMYPTGTSASNPPSNGPVFQANINGAPLSSPETSSFPMNNMQAAKPGTSNSTNGNNNQFNLHLLPKLHEEEEVNPPLRSPSMLKPFRPNPQLVRRRGGTVYVFAIIGGAFTLFILFVVLLSGGGAASSHSGSSSMANRLRKHSPGHVLAPYYNAAVGAAGGSSNSIARLSSYLGSYLPFLDTYYNSAAMISLTSSAYLFGHTSNGVHTLHPILPLLRGASLKANNLVSRQSNTLTQAVANYRKRYKKDPPKGFDKWWSFAKARNHTLVDEYDSLMQDISKFATLSPNVLRTRTRTLAQLQSVSLITIKSGKAQIHSKSGKWAPALALQEMMNAFVTTLPDMEIAINEKPEGRILPGQWKQVNLDEWEDEDFPVQTESLQSEFLGPSFETTV